ncbi:hypothetical protein IJG76_00770 [Candidatus Saccharibacteria bacterium]|nr:hypothetical protein [Candidatus Saccharibacteria bacterium]
MDDEKQKQDNTPDASTDNGGKILSGKPALTRVASRIRDVENILVAISSNPSVDELAAAIGFSLVLDEIGKHATVIYSGATPNALKFLEPEKTFEENTNSLQDFIIMLDKEKADHLRYKIDGDFVKIFITPYRVQLSEDDLEFSHGDFNVDLIVALNVSSATDLDNALREHGRIVHDASTININNGIPGKLGEIEWSDPTASSVSELVSDLSLELLGEDKKLDTPAATAFYAGFVAATEHFSNAKTTAEALMKASALVGLGVNPQEVADNVAIEGSVEEDDKKPEDGTFFDREKDNKKDEKKEREIDFKEVKEPEPTPEKSDESAPSASEEKPTEPVENSVENSAPEAPKNEIVHGDTLTENIENPENPGVPEVPLSSGGGLTLDPNNAVPPTNNYGEMLKSALDEALGNAPKPESENTNPVVEEMVNRLQSEPASIAPAMPTEAPDNTGVPDMNFNQPALEAPAEMQPTLTDAPAPQPAKNSVPQPVENPAPAPAPAQGIPTPNNPLSTPVTPSQTPETPSALQSAPLPMPDSEILPPPPAPPVDFNNVPPSTGPTLPPVAMPAAPEPAPVEPQPVENPLAAPLNQPVTQMPNPVAGNPGYAVGNDPAVMNAVLNADLASQPAPMAPTPAPMNSAPMTPNTDPGTFHIPGA